MLYPTNADLETAWPAQNETTDRDLEYRIYEKISNWHSMNGGQEELYKYELANFCVLLRHYDPEHVRLT